MDDKPKNRDKAIILNKIINFHAISISAKTFCLKSCIDASKSELSTTEKTCHEQCFESYNKLAVLSVNSLSANKKELAKAENQI